MNEKIKPKQLAEIATFFTTRSNLIFNVACKIFKVKTSSG